MSTTTKEKITTEKQALTAVSLDAFAIQDLPEKLKTKKVCETATKNARSQTIYFNVPRDLRTFSMFYKCAPDYGSETKEYAEIGIKPEWGISVSGFVALVKKGKLPNLKKVTDPEIILTCYKRAFKENPFVIVQMPEDIKTKILNENNIDSVIHYKSSRGQYSRSMDWKGDVLISHVPEDLITNKNIENFRKILLEELERGNSISLSEIPSKYMTRELYKKVIEKRPNYLDSVPEEFKSEELCKLAVSKNGSALTGVPKEMRKDFYLDVAKSGEGLSNIPEEERTEKICMIAFDKSQEQFRYVPEDKRSYAMCLSAVDGDARQIEYVPVEHQDEEMMIRLITSIFRKTYTKGHGNGYELVDERYRNWDEEDDTKKEALLTTVLNRFFDSKEGSYQRKNEVRELVKEVLTREPQLYNSMVFHSGDEDNKDSFNRKSEFSKYFGGITCFELAEVAAKNDITVVSTFKAEYQQIVWTEFLKNK